MNWELREEDQEFFYRELDGFLPQRIFDAHAHLYKIHHWKDFQSQPFRFGPKVVTLEVFREQIKWITPGRHTDGLFFGAGLYDATCRAANDFVAAEIGKDSGCRSLMIVSPYMDPEEIRETVKKNKFIGLKVYHHFAKSTPTFDAHIEEFLTEEHVRIAHQEGLIITLHIVRERALADPANQEMIRFYCEEYPNIKLILAHAARGFNPHHTIEGIKALQGLRNVWCDTSAITECGALEAIIRSLGHDRLLWGSDYPISHLRGRCIAVGDQFLWLTEENLDWRKVTSRTVIKPLLWGLESLRTLKLAAWQLRLSDSKVEDIFWNNAVQLFSC